MLTIDKGIQIVLEIVLPLFLWFEWRNRIEPFLLVRFDGLNPGTLGDASDNGFLKLKC